MPGSLNQFVLISARKSRGGEWSPDDYDVRDNAGSSRAHHAAPAGTGKSFLVLDDNDSGHSAISSQSRLFTEPRTSDGGF